MDGLTIVKIIGWAILIVGGSISLLVAGAFLFGAMMWWRDRKFFKNHDKK